MDGLVGRLWLLLRGNRLGAGPTREVEAERARAAELVTRFDWSLGVIDWDRIAERDVAGRALTARDALGPLLGSDDLADLVGAGVLARVGARDLERGRCGRGDALVTCFFDPRHDDASGSVRRWLGGREVEVPSCSPCADVVRAGGTPPHLRVETGGAVVAYWERDDVWARTGFGATSDHLARDVLAEWRRD